MSFTFGSTRTRPPAQDVSLSVKTPALSRLATGGGKSKTYELSNLKRSKTSDRPKLLAGKRSHLDNAVTVGGNKVWLMERLAKFRPAKKLQAGDGGKPGTTGTTAPKGTDKKETSEKSGAPNSVSNDLSTKPPTQHQEFETVRQKVDGVRQKLDSLREDLASGAPMTGRERREMSSKAASTRAELANEVKTALADIEKQRKTLTSEIGLLDAKVKSGGGTESDKKTLTDKRALLDNLDRLRAGVLRQTLSIQLPGMEALLEKRISKSAVLNLGMAYREDTANNGYANKYIAHLGETIDRINEGATQVSSFDGRTMTVAEFKTEVIDPWATALKEAGGPANLKLANSLESLSGEIGRKTHLDTMVGTIAGFLDRNPGFPLTEALKTLPGAIPRLREDANSSEPKRVLLAAESLSTLFDLVDKGHAFPSIQGLNQTFDDACLKIKQKVFGDRAVDHYTTLCANIGEPVPSKEELQACSGPFEKLTESDKQILQKFKDTHGLDSLEVAYKKIHAYHEKRSQGEAAAKMRHDLNGMNKTLRDILVGDRPRVFKSSSVLSTKDRTALDKLLAMPKDEKLFDALCDHVGKKKVKEVTILFAYLAQYEVDTHRQEQKLFGMHPSTRFAMPKAIGEGDASKGPLSAFGITNAKLEKLGLVLDRTNPKFDESKDVAAVIEKLSKQGIGSLQDVRDANKAINDVSKIVFKSELSQEMIRDYEASHARALGQRLVNELATDLQRVYSGRFPSDHEHAVPSLETETVVKGLQDRIGTLQVELGAPLKKTSGNSGGETLLYAGDKALWDELKTEGDFYTAVETTVGKSYEALRTIDTNIDASQSKLGELAHQLKMRLDPNAPKGLESSKLILKLASEYELFAKSKLPEHRTALETTLKALRGYNLETGHRTWYGKLGLGKDLKIDDFLEADDKGGKQFNVNLRDVASQIVFIRESAPHLIGFEEERLGEAAEIMNSLLESRRARNPQAMQRVVDAVRLAVLAEWTSTKGEFNYAKGTFSEAFDPASDGIRKKIEARLTSWGLDIDQFRPEFDDVLMSRMSPDDLIRWASEANWSEATRKEYLNEHPEYTLRESIANSFKEALKEIRHEFTIDGLLNRRVMDEQTKTVLLSTLQSLQEGDKLDLKSGQKITLDSRKIPVEPTGLVGLQAKLSLAHVGQFEIERGSSGYKLSMRVGIDGKASLDALVGKKFKFGGGIVELTAQGSAGVEVGGSRLVGVTFSFAGSDSGMRALTDLVGKMVDEPGKIGLSDWQEASDVGNALEWKTKIGANAGLLGRAQVGGKGPELDGKKDVLGVGLTGQLQVGVARGTKSSVTENFNQVVQKGEVEYSLTLGASLNFYARLYNPLNIGTGFAATESGGQKGADSHFGKDSSGSSNYSMNDNVQNTDLLGIGGTKTYVCTDKWKHEREGYGLYKKCEVVRQANVRRDVLKAFAVCGTGDMEKRLKDPAFEKEFKSFMQMCSSGDFLAATYSLKPEKLTLANDYMQQAIEARRQNRPKDADSLEADAKRVVDEPDNYRLDKFALINTTVKKSEITNLNANWIKWDTYAEGKREVTGVTFKV